MPPCASPVLIPRGEIPSLSPSPSKTCQPTQPSNPSTLSEAATTPHGDTRRKKVAPRSNSGPQDFEFPYRLNNEWTVWYNNTARKKEGAPSFQQQMKRVFEFDSVKTFWEMYNRIDFEHMPVGATLRIFKKNIQPTWEDPRNANGGTWHLVPKLHTANKVAVYKELVLAMIAGDLGPLINGIVLSVKNQDTIISLWCESSRSKKYGKVKCIAAEILGQHCTSLVQAEGVASIETRLEWTWRAHPSAKPEESTSEQRRERRRLARETPGLQSLELQDQGRGGCGDCLGRFDTCTVQ